MVHEIPSHYYIDPVIVDPLSILSDSVPLIMYHLFVCSDSIDRVTWSVKVSGVWRVFNHKMGHGYS
jgi:hypothetical protein